MIVLELSQVMDSNHIGLKELAERVGITNVNLSRHKTNKVRAMRFTTLDGLCEALGCQPGDIIKYVPDEDASTPEPRE